MRDANENPAEDPVSKQIRHLNDAYAEQVKHAQSTITDPEALKVILEEILAIHRQRLKSVLDDRR